MSNPIASSKNFGIIRRRKASVFAVLRRDEMARQVASFFRRRLWLWLAVP